MNTMTIDIGNTNVKVDLWADDGYMFRLDENKVNSENIEDTIRNFSLKGAIVASVRKDYEDIIKPFQNIENFPVVIFDQEEIKRCYKEENKYKGPVGVDRFAAFLGVRNWMGSRPAMIIDAGTAITTDISHNNCFIGGNISLGVETRLKALHHYTSMLPELEYDWRGKFFGNDTVSAIEGGLRMGLEGELTLAVKKAKELYDIHAVFITGGDAMTVRSCIYPEFNYCNIDEFLVARGLNYHLRKFYLQKEAHPYNRI